MDRIDRMASAIARVMWPGQMANPKTGMDSLTAYQIRVAREAAQACNAIAIDDDAKVSINCEIKVDGPDIARKVAEHLELSRFNKNNGMIRI